LRSQHQSQRAVIGPIANKDLLKEIDRRIVTLFAMAEVVPKCDCGLNPRRKFAGPGPDVRANVTAEDSHP
jgi:hypothetical protein